MNATEFDDWLAGNAAQQSPIVAVQQLYDSLGCASCHGGRGEGGRGPGIVGLFGRQVQLTNGQTVHADEGYIRESIENPQAKVVAGFSPIMPTFQGQVTPEQLIQIIDRKSTRLNSSHSQISYAVFCLKKKNKKKTYYLRV